MKHLLVFLLFAAIAYSALHICTEEGRSRALRFFSRHGLRFGVLVALVFALLAVAYYATSVRIL